MGEQRAPRRVGSRLRRAIRSGQERRLEPLLPEQRHELERLGARASSEPWHQEASALLQEAEHALHEGRAPATAWEAFLASARAKIGGFDEPAITAKAIELGHEAREKVTSWRRRSIEDALKIATDASAPLDAKRTALAKAWSLRDEEMQNRYFRLEELKRQLLTVGAVLLVAILGTLISLGSAQLDLSEAPSATDASVWALTALFGMLGGSISAFQSISRQRGGTRIPEQLTQSAIAVFRPLIGAAGALGAGVLLAAGIITIASNTTAAVFSVAFAAGFSERFVTRAISSVVRDPARDGSQES